MPTREDMDALLAEVQRLGKRLERLAGIEQEAIALARENDRLRHELHQATKGWDL